jgi:site-specific recombinase
MSAAVMQALRHWADCRPRHAVVQLARLKADLAAAGLSPEAGIEALVAVLREHLELRDAVARQVGHVLSTRSHRHLYADTGVLAPIGFSQTLRSRLSARLLPHVPREDLLRDVFMTSFRADTATAWVLAVPVVRWAALFAVLLESPAFDAGCARAGSECDAALALLAARAAGLAVDPDRLRYAHSVLGPAATNEADALALPTAIQSWIAARAANATASPKELLRCIVAAEAEAKSLRDAALTHGTSIALAHSLHAAQQTLGRLRQMALIRSATDPAVRAERCAALFVALVDAQRTELSLGDVFGRVADDVAHRITEHASKTGEHYVTDDRQQWWAMLRAAAGAGVIVAVMALLKVFIGKAHMAPLWETLCVCLNYGVGFVFIHLLHFTVATKQPAMTATLLAARMGAEEATPVGAARLADLIVRTVRTQVVAIVGNVGLALPSAAAIFLAWHALTGISPVPDAKALHMLSELNPWASWALLHAAIAGVCLFLSGVISGYYDNLCVFGRIGERIARHPLALRVLGPARTARVAAYVESNLGALLGNLSFGFMLGGVGFIGFLTGLPIDIRHVAFASANTAYGLLTLDGQVAASTIVATVLGVLAVAAVNVLVSYGLAFATALRARRVRYERAELVVRLVLKRLLHRPQDFIWPPSETTGH